MYAWNATAKGLQVQAFVVSKLKPVWVIRPSTEPKVHQKVTKVSQNARHDKMQTHRVDLIPLNPRSQDGVYSKTPNGMSQFRMK